MAATRPLLLDERGARAKICPPGPMRFSALDRTGQVGSAQRARPAVRLGQLQVGRLIREPQLRVLALTRQWAIDGLRLPGEQGQ